LKRLAQSPYFNDTFKPVIDQRRTIWKKLDDTASVYPKNRKGPFRAFSLRLRSHQWTAGGKLASTRLQHGDTT